MKTSNKIVQHTILVKFELTARYGPALSDSSFDTGRLQIHLGIKESLQLIRYEF